jgi:hypothetical protein
MNTVNMYVGLIPIVCRQYSGIGAIQKGGIQEYVNSLKSIMIEYLVTFQESSQSIQVVSKLITEIIGLVMPSFFRTNKPGGLDQNTTAIESNDSYYFF